MQSLAQCPYCNQNTAQINQSAARFHVICLNCHAAGPSDESHCAAMRRWNYLANELRRSREWYARDFSRQLTEVAAKLTSSS